MKAAFAKRVGRSGPSVFFERKKAEELPSNGSGASVSGQKLKGSMGAVCGLSAFRTLGSNSCQSAKSRLGQLRPRCGH